MSIEELKRQIEKAKASEAFQDVYEQQLTLVLARFKKASVGVVPSRYDGMIDVIRLQAAVAMVSALPSGPRDSTVKQGLMRQFAVCLFVSVSVIIRA